MSECGICGDTGCDICDPAPTPSKPKDDDVERVRQRDWLAQFLWSAPLNPSMAQCIEAADRIVAALSIKDDEVTEAANTALGNIMNIRIDLETGCTKANAINALDRVAIKLRSVLAMRGYVLVENRG